MTTETDAIGTAVFLCGLIGINVRLGVTATAQVGQPFDCTVKLIEIVRGDED